MDLSKYQKINYKAGEAIFEENDPGHQMYYIISGQVEIFIRVEGVKECLVVLEAGQFFGELALFNQSNRNAHAQADIDCELMIIQENNLITLIQDDHNIVYKLIHNLSNHLERLTHQYEELLGQKIAVEKILYSKYS